MGSVVFLGCLWLVSVVAMFFVGYQVGQEATVDRIEEAMSARRGSPAPAGRENTREKRVF